MKGFLHVFSRNQEREFLLAVNNITSVANERFGSGTVIHLRQGIDMHGDVVKTDLPLAKVKTLLEKAQQG